MTRLHSWTVGCALALTWVAPLKADDPVGRSLRVQHALSAGRQQLAASEFTRAIATLESALPEIDGNAAYLAELRRAYVLYLKQAQLGGGDPETTARVRERLGRLEGIAPAAPQTASRSDAAPSGDLFSQTPRDVAAKAEAAPEPDPAPSGDAPVEQAKPAATEEADPLKGALDAAKAAFARKDWPAADKLFRELSDKQYTLTTEELRGWAYCRLVNVTRKIKPTLAPAGRSALLAEVDAACGLTDLPAELTAYAGKLRAKLGSPAATPVIVPASASAPVEATPVAAATPAEWEAVEAGSFVVHHRGRAVAARDAARVAELCRRQTFDRWSGPVKGDWSPRCELFLHPDAASFAQATGKTVPLPGTARVEQTGRRVSARRIDIRLDDVDWQLLALPHQVAHLVLTDLSLDQPLPRWAGEAMAVLAEPPSRVARYLAHVAPSHARHELIPLAELLPMSEYPDAARITPFCAESVSLVEFLTHLRGPRVFLAFLLESPRYGVEKSLTRHYGFRTIADLERQWLAHAVPAQVSAAAPAGE